MCGWLWHHYRIKELEGALPPVGWWLFDTQKKNEAISRCAGDCDKLFIVLIIVCVMCNGYTYTKSSP